MAERNARGGSAFEVLAVFTRLGLTSFGGPIAHLGYFRTEVVERRGWLDAGRHGDATPTRGWALRRRTAAALLIVFAALLVALPLAREASGARPVAVADAFYRTGALVFGGGHVVLPLLQAEVVPAGWVDDGTFIAGYGAAQAVPGPLFTFAAYLGAATAPGAQGLWLAAVALLAVFAPSFLLVLGVLPFWEQLRATVAVRRALTGINAAVVGLLLAALYHPVFASAVSAPRDAALVLAAYLALAVWRLPPWLVVLLGAGTRALLGELQL